MLENPWSAVGNPTSALGPSGSSFGPSSLAPIGIHHLFAESLTADHAYHRLDVDVRVTRVGIRTVLAVLGAAQHARVPVTVAGRDVRRAAATGHLPRHHRRRRVRHPSSRLPPPPDQSTNARTYRRTRVTQGRL